MSDDFDKDLPDGQYDGEVEKFKTIKTVETKMADDGVQETHITHELKLPNRYTVSGFHRENYEKIDWSK